MAFLKLGVKLLDAVDFLNIFLRFWGFWRSLFKKNYPCKKPCTCVSQLELICKIYYRHISFSLIYKILRAIVRFFFKFFPMFNFYWIILSFLVIIIFESLVFKTLCRSFLISWKFNSIVAACKKISISSSFLGIFVVAVFFLIKSGESMYETLRLKFILWHRYPWQK